jgi:hypothetical protein
MVLRLQEHIESAFLRRQPQQALRRALTVAGSLFALALLVSGCAGKADDVGAPPCPKVAALADAAHMTVFRSGAGRDLTDISYEADIGRIGGECIYNRRKTSVTVDMKLVITAKRGPADQKRFADLAYFVAIVDAQANVLARQEFQSQVTFPEDQDQVATLEELQQIIPLKKDQPGSDYDVLVGFRLSRDQVERNRGRGQ